MLLGRRLPLVLKQYRISVTDKKSLSSKVSCKGTLRKVDSSPSTTNHRVSSSLQAAKWGGEVEDSASLDTSKMYEALTSERVEADCMDLKVPDSAKQLYGRSAGSKIAFSGYLDPYLSLEKWSSRFLPSTSSFALRIRTLGMIGKYEDIPSVLERMELVGIRPNMEVYYALAFAYSRVGKIEELFGVLKKVEASGYPLDNALLCTLVTCLMKQGDISSTLELLMHRVFRDLKFPVPVDAQASGIASKQSKRSKKNNNHMNKPAALACAKFSDEWDKKLHFIAKGHDVVIWTALMKGLLDLGEYRRTLQVFDHMRLRGLEPDCVTYDIAIQACGHLEDMMRAKEIFRCFPQGQEKMASGAVYSSLIFCAANCNDVESAEQFYQEAVAEDIPLGYRGRFHLLRAYGKRGVYDRAVHIYESLKSLPRSTLPSIHDWFLLFLSLKQALKSSLGKNRPSGSTECSDVVEKTVVALADKYLEEGLQLAIDVRHLYGVKERYFDICLLSGRLKAALNCLREMSRDPQLPFHIPRTRGCFYRAWARYIVEKGTCCLGGIEEALQDMKSCQVPWNEPCVLAAICMYSELGYPQRALDMLRRAGVEGFWLPIGKAVVFRRDENSEHYLVASPAERLDALKRLRDACRKHSPGLVSILKSYIEQVGYPKSPTSSSGNKEMSRLCSSSSEPPPPQDSRKQVVDMLLMKTSRA